MDRSSPRSPAKRPATLFAPIARRYDLANTVLSAGLHHVWKRQAIAAAGVQPGERVLDAGTGTGDLAELAVGRGALVTAVDASLDMLRIAKRRRPAGRLTWVGGDITNLPFRSAWFDIVLTGFTLRHPTNLDEGLRELKRVLAPAGRLVILEFARPIRPFVRAAYRAYSALIPAIGGWVTGDPDAYAYLVESIRRFPGQVVLAKALSEVGFAAVAYRNLSGGIVAIHTAVRQA